MTLSQNRTALFVISVIWSMATGCHPSGVSTQEKSEFKAFVRALDALSSAPEYDRGVRLEELESIPCKTERIAALKASCVASYQEFQNALGLLKEAREKTAQTEAAVQRARESKESGGSIGREQENALLKMSQSTSQSLEAVNTALNKAESLVGKCEAERKALEVLISQQ